MGATVFFPSRHTAIDLPAIGHRKPLIAMALCRVPALLHPDSRPGTCEMVCVFFVYCGLFLVLLWAHL